MRFLLLLHCLALLVPGAENPLEIVRRAVARDQDNLQRVKDYTFEYRVEKRKLNPDGEVASRESKTFDVLILGGEPYERLIQKDDRPLDAEEEKEAQEKLERTLRKLREETPAQKAKRLAKAEKERREGQELLREVPNAFRFDLVGEDRVDGRAVWVIRAEPRPDYQPRVRQANILKKLRGTVWVDKNEYQVVRVDAEPVDTISFGLFLARLGKGSRVQFRQTRVHNELWLPEEVQVKVDGRMALVRKLNQEILITFRNYRKFQSDSRLVSAAELPR
jgi:hypothetical protein